MTAETITPNDDDITSCDNYGAISSREPCCDHGRQLDHLDTMLHSVMVQLGDMGGDIGGMRVMLDELAPLIPLIPLLAKRAATLLDPGAAMRRSMKRGKADV